MSGIFNIGFIELFVIGLIALIVVGPKDLPRLMKAIGKVAGQIRGIADEFKAGLNEMARQAEIDEMRQEIAALKAQNPLKDVQDEVDALKSDLQGEIADAHEEMRALTADERRELGMDAEITQEANEASDRDKGDQTS